jgi:hypothetical protein
MYTVISGVFYIGLGDQFDATKVEAPTTIRAIRRRRTKLEEPAERRMSAHAAGGIDPWPPAFSSLRAGSAAPREVRV